MSRGVKRMVPAGARRWMRAVAQRALAHPALRTERATAPRRGPRPRVHIGVNYFGAGNIGDDLMLSGFLRALGARAGRLSLTCCTPYDLESQQRRFPAITWLPDDEATRELALADADVWLALGDTPFQMLSGPWMLDHLAAQVDAATALRVPMFYLGAGAEGPEVLDDPTFRALVSAADRIWCRDAASARAVAAHATCVVETGADLCHVYLGDQAWPPLRRRDAGPGADLGLLLAFEQYATAFDSRAIERLVSGRAGVTWLVQEVRDFPGSERDLLGRLSSAATAGVAVAVPSYASAPSTRALLASWPSCAVAASSRYHGLQILAWQGTRLVAVSRSGKIAGAAEDLGLPHSTTTALASALPDARAVPRDRLEHLAQSARTMVDDFCRTIGVDAARPRRRARAADFRKVAVVKLDGLGDFVLATPFLRELTSVWPDAEITAFIRPAAADVARCCPAVSHVVVAAEPEGRDVTSTTRFDAVFVPRASSDHLGGIALAARLDAAVRVGFARTARTRDTAGFTHLVPQPRPASHAHINLQLLWPFSSGPFDDGACLEPSAAARRRWRDRLGSLAERVRPLCLIGLGGGHDWKRWPADRWAEVVAAVRDDHGLVPLLIGAPEDRAIADDVLARESRGVLSAVGEDIDGVCALAELSALYVGHDTGPKHVAAAFGARVVELNPFLLDDPVFAESHPLFFHAHGVPQEVLSPSPGLPSASVERGDAIRTIGVADVREAIARVLAADV